MRSQLHADDLRPWPARRNTEERRLLDDLPRYKTRPRWLIFLARHFAPRNHERYQMQGSELPQEVWDRAFPPLTEEEEARLEEMGVKRATGEQIIDFKPVRPRPWWLAFLYRHLPLRDE
ncbi:MAG: hypothetical protein ACJ8J0_23880 [Longimicrobiaceae bacterium]